MRCLTEIINMMNISMRTDPESNRLELMIEDEKNKSRLSVEFVKGPLGYRRIKGGGKHEAIAKAVGLHHYQKPISVLDATAGFGQDAFILASLGCRLHVVEQSPMVAALLADGLKRASADPVIGSWASLITLTVANSQDILDGLKSSDYPMVVYLDPMFPASQKTAASSLKMRVLRELVCDIPVDAASLLHSARLKAQKRVVVKRPKGASTLTEEAPHFCIRSRSYRYDVYLPIVQHEDF